MVTRHPLCRLAGHDPTIEFARGQTFVRDGVKREAKPTTPPRVVCRRCDRELDIEVHDPDKDGIVLVFRDCKECGQSIGCLIESDSPTSCEEHS